jgi:hypothetical protein
MRMDPYGTNAAPGNGGIGRKKIVGGGAREGHVAAGLELLVDYDYIAGSARSIGPLGGRPAIRYEINPRGLK